MSAPLAGKFQDHYEVLGVDPRADLETIQNVYSALAQKFHPGNANTGSKEKFDAVNLAFEVLSDPNLRREFDKLKGVGEEETVPKFSGIDFFASLGQGAGLRNALLCVLYDRRRANPFRPSLSMRNIENMLVASTEELNFALWYLKQRGLVTSDDKSSLQITADGVEFLENNVPTPDSVIRLIKPAALTIAKVNGKTQPKPPTAPAPPALEHGKPAAATEAARLRALNRILSHGAKETPHETEDVRSS